MCFKGISFFLIPPLRGLAICPSLFFSSELDELGSSGRATVRGAVQLCEIT